MKFVMAVYRQSRRGARRFSLKKRKTWTKARRSYKGTTFATKWLRPESGLPDTTVVKLHYSDTFNMTSLLGAVVSNSFRMNSIFDPDFTGAGHQPLYHDSWSTLYGRYVVKYSRMRVTFSDNDTTAGSNWLVGVLSDDNGTISATPNTNVEQTNSVSSILTPSGGSFDRCTLYSVPYTPKSRLGLPASDDTAGATFGSNPGATWFSSVWGANIAATASSTITVKVDIDFYVQLNRVASQTGS